MASCICPTCKQPISDIDELLIDAATGVVQRGTSRTIISRGNCARVLTALRDAYPGEVSIKRLLEAVYGDDSDGGPLFANTCIHVAIHHLRTPLRTIGVAIVAAFGAYRLELLPLPEMEKAA
jgi:DNA-binding winged helix-turn-helix (wHTH) protein